jgi:hypothetical protein
MKMNRNAELKEQIVMANLLLLVNNINLIKFKKAFNYIIDEELKMAHRKEIRMLTDVKRQKFVFYFNLFL